MNTDSSISAWTGSSDFQTSSGMLAGFTRGKPRPMSHSLSAGPSDMTASRRNSSCRGKGASSKTTSPVDLLAFTWDRSRP